MQNDIVKQPQAKQLAPTLKSDVSANDVKAPQSQPKLAESKPENSVKPDKQIDGAQASQPKNNSSAAAIVIAVIIFLVLAGVAVFAQIQG